MINRLFISITLVLCAAILLSSCDKYEKQQRRLDGNWNLVEYKFKSQLGLSYFPEASGSIFFEDCNDTICAYSMSLEFSSPQITGTRIEAGKYSLEKEGGRLYMTPIINGVDQNRISNGMTLLTRTNLQFQYTDDQGRSHHYIFEKQ